APRTPPRGKRETVRFPPRPSETAACEGGRFGILLPLLVPLVPLLAVVGHPYVFPAYKRQVGKPGSRPLGDSVRADKVVRPLGGQESTHRTEVGVPGDGIFPNGPPAQEPAGPRIDGQFQVGQKLSDVNASTKDHPWSLSSGIYLSTVSLDLLEGVHWGPLAAVKHPQMELPRVLEIAWELQFQDVYIVLALRELPGRFNGVARTLLGKFRRIPRCLLAGIGYKLQEKGQILLCASFSHALDQPLLK